MDGEDNHATSPSRQSRDWRAGSIQTSRPQRLVAIVTVLVLLAGAALTGRHAVMAARVVLNHGRATSDMGTAHGMSGMGPSQREMAVGYALPPVKIQALTQMHGMVMTSVMTVEARRDMAAVDLRQSCTPPPRTHAATAPLRLHSKVGVKVFTLEAAVIRWSILSGSR
jgi:hypothetical protein